MRAVGSAIVVVAIDPREPESELGDNISFLREADPCRRSFLEYLKTSSKQPNPLSDRSLRPIISVGCCQ